MPADAQGLFAARLTRQRLLQRAAGACCALAGLPSRMATQEIGENRPPRLMVFAWLLPHDPAGLASLIRHARTITHVSPAWFSMDRDLTIRGYAGLAVTAIARQNGIRLVPLISNRGFNPAVAESILATAGRRAEAAARISELVLQSGFDGINLDFEGPFGGSRDRYADFVTRLGGLLRRDGRLLTVDVVPQLVPPSDRHADTWAAPYDYPALAAGCDALMLMCYSYSVQHPGPVAPLWWTQAAVEFALSEVPPRKLVVGLDFAGREWTIKGKHTTYVDVTQSQALALLKQSGARLHRPAADASPTFSWRDGAGEHIVHFEDTQSLGAKLAIVRAAGLAGGTFWRLGQDDPSIWPVIAQELR